MTHDEMTCDLFNDRLMDYLEHDTADDVRAAFERHAVRCGDCGPLLADLRKLRIDAANMPALAPARDLWAGIAERIETPVVAIGSGRPAVARARSRGWGRRALFAASLVAAVGVGYSIRGTPPEAVAPVALDPVPGDIAGAPDTMRVSEPDAAPAVPAPATSVASAPGAPGAPGGGSTLAPGATTAAGLPAAATATPNTPRPLEVQLAVATLRADYDREIARLRTLIEQRRSQLDPVTVGIIERNLAVIDTAIAESHRAVAADPSSRFLIEFLNQSLQNKVELMRTVAMLPNRT